MSPRTPDQWTRIRQEKRGIILQTALELFATRGYHETTISLIAQEAGISKGLVYNYFDSKEALLAEIISEGMGELLQDLQVEDPKPFTKEKLQHYIHDTFRKLEENTKFYQLFFSLIIQPRVLTIFRENFFSQILPMMNLLEKYYADRGEDDPKAKTYLFVAVLDGVGMDYIADREGYPLEKVKQLILKMFI